MLNPYHFYIYHQLKLKVFLKPFSLESSQRIASIIESILINEHVSTQFDLDLANLGLFKKSNQITNTEQALLIKQKVIDECKKQGLNVSKTVISQTLAQYTDPKISMSTLKKRNN